VKERRLAVRNIRTCGAFVLFAALVGLSTPTGGQVPSPTAEDLFNNGVLQRIDLSINTRDFEKLKANFQDNDYYPVTIAWRGNTMRNAWARSRGSGSRSGTKPGLRVDFNRNAAGAQEWLGLKSLILDNLKQDSSGMHEMLATRFFERMGIPAPHEAFAELYVNNRFAGLYVVIEPVDKRFLARAFGAHEDGNVENDGYLYEYKWKFPYVLNYLGPELEQYKEVLEAKTHENESMAALYDPIFRMVREINDARDDLFERNVSPYLDLHLFMRHVAIQSMLAEWDGLLGYAGINNFYLYRFEKQTLSQFLLWDADNTFHAIDYSITAEHDTNVLMRRAMRIPALRNTYFNVLLDAARSAEEYSDEEALSDKKLGLAPRGWLEREIDRLYTQIRPAMRADPVKAFTSDDFEEAVAYMRRFARERGPYVRCEATKITNPGKTRSVCPAEEF
jgi:spore coat protein H